jgi:general secretion pathway protein M
VSLRERYARLEEREKRLFGVLIAFVGFAVLLAPPLALLAVVHSARTENEDIRAALQAIADDQTDIAKAKATKSAVAERYSRPAPPLAAFLSKIASEAGVEIPESQDRQAVPHGKKFEERSTKINLRKVGMLKLVRFMEKIEQSGHPVRISQVNIHKRGSEPDSYDVEMIVSAFDRNETKDPKAKAAAKDGGAEEPAADESAEDESGGDEQ